MNQLRKINFALGGTSRGKAAVCTQSSSYLNNMPNTSRIMVAPLAALLWISIVPAQGWAVASPTPETTTMFDQLAAGISTSSGTAEMALAEHLTRTGAKMYGAYWCSHCTTQKQLFGREAWQKISYVECDRGGQNPNPGACNQIGVRAFPTWRINSKSYTGQMSLFRLAKLSGYRGNTNFRNRI
jgi:hypothetical protein